MLVWVVNGWLEILCEPVSVYMEGEAKTVKFAVVGEGGAAVLQVAGSVLLFTLGFDGALLLALTQLLYSAAMCAGIDIVIIILNHRYRYSNNNT